jgi:hypothetical protein
MRSTLLALAATALTLLVASGVALAAFAGETNSARPPEGAQPEVPNYTAKAAVPAPEADLMMAEESPVFMVYKDFNAWWGDNRDSATLEAMGKTFGTDWFVRPVSDCANGVPSGVDVVVFTSNSEGFVSTTAAQNDPACQASLEAFLATGGTLIVDMADNDDAGGFVAPGATGTPIYAGNGTEDATIAPNAKGTDGVLRTADDHPLIKGPDGIAATADDLTNSNMDGGNWTAHGHLADGITLPNNAVRLVTGDFGGVQKPIVAEYNYGGGRVILDTITKEFYTHQPSGFGPSYFLRSLFAYAEIYNFSGFFSPVDNPPTLNVVEAGRAVPMKFSLGGNEGLDIFAEGYPVSRRISCASSAPQDGIEQTISAGQSSLSYDATTERYTYAWKTKEAWSGTCRQLTVKLDDGSIHQANFKLR